MNSCVYKISIRDSTKVVHDPSGVATHVETRCSKQTQGLEEAFVVVNSPQWLACCSYVVPQDFV